MENFESVLQDIYTSSVNFKIGLLQYNFELEILNKCFFFENPLRVRDQTQ